MSGRVGNEWTLSHTEGLPCAFSWDHREFQEGLKNIQLVPTGAFSLCHGTQANARYIQDFTAAEWKGEDGDDPDQGLVKCMCSQSFKRHHTIAKASAFLCR